MNLILAQLNLYLTLLNNLIKDEEMLSKNRIHNISSARIVITTPWFPGENISYTREIVINTPWAETDGSCKSASTLGKELNNEIPITGYGCAHGLIIFTTEFDDSLEEFKEYD